MKRNSRAFLMVIIRHLAGVAGITWRKMGLAANFPPSSYRTLCHRFGRTRGHTRSKRLFCSRRVVPQLRNNSIQLPLAEVLKLT